MKRNIWNIAFRLSLIVTLSSGILLFSAWGRNWLTVRYWRGLARQKQAAENWTGKGILPQYQSLYEANPDMVGWLKIDGAHINYPVMQTKDDPEYYLWRNFNKEKEDMGTPFADYRCDVVPIQSFNTIIYGHNTIFRWLFEYAYQNRLYRKNRYIQFDTLTETGTYEVAAVFYADSTDARLIHPWNAQDDQAYEFYNYIEVDSAYGFQKYAEKINQNKLYETETSVSMDSRVITLISCATEAFSGIEKNGRLVVIAKQVYTHER